MVLYVEFVNYLICNAQSTVKGIQEETNLANHV